MAPVHTLLSIPQRRMSLSANPSMPFDDQDAAHLRKGDRPRCMDSLVRSAKVLLKVSEHVVDAVDVLLPITTADHAELRCLANRKSGLVQDIAHPDGACVFEAVRHFDIYLDVSANQLANRTNRNPNCHERIPGGLKRRSAHHCSSLSEEQPLCRARRDHVQSSCRNRPLIARFAINLKKVRSAQISTTRPQSNTGFSGFPVRLDIYPRGLQTTRDWSIQ